ncbi:Uncharacterised protein [Mycobacteroides abscessus subsp. massiliense]|nr:Uncharacterised protein [Mycobacteroides abscessus subsp. massiliense]
MTHEREDARRDRQRDVLRTDFAALAGIRQRPQDRLIDPSGDCRRHVVGQLVVGLGQQAAVITDPDPVQLPE